MWCPGWSECSWDPPVNCCHSGRAAKRADPEPRCMERDSGFALTRAPERRGWINVSRNLRTFAEPRAYPRVGIGILRDVADDGDGIGAGGVNVRGLFELDAADRNQRDIADAALPFGDLRNALR